jgi:hypothetical protein
MIRDDLDSREAEIIRTLSSLPKGFVVIGGYAVSALSVHRFSVDCDIVVSGKGTKNFAASVRAEGYAKAKSAKGFDDMYQSEVEVYGKDVGGTRVSVDLFINGVTSRRTRASWSYEYVKENSTEAMVAGARNSAEVVVPTKELLMALKIHSGRDVDMRDLVMLSEGVDWDAVLKHASRGEKDALLRQLTDIIGVMGEKQFAQSLRATFSLRRSIDPLISECRKNLSWLRTMIEASEGKPRA